MSASKAKTLSCTINSSKFFSVFVLHLISFVIKSLVIEKKKKKNVDALKAQENIEDVRTTFITKRQNSEFHFNIFVRGVCGCSTISRYRTMQT